MNEMRILNKKHAATDNLVTGMLTIPQSPSSIKMM